MGNKMKRSAASQPQQGIKHSAPSSRFRTFAPAPSASLLRIIIIIIVLLLLLLILFSSSSSSIIVIIIISSRSIFINIIFREPGRSIASAAVTGAEGTRTSRRPPCRRCRCPKLLLRCHCHQGGDTSASAAKHAARTSGRQDIVAATGAALALSPRGLPSVCRPYEFPLVPAPRQPFVSDPKHMASGYPY